VVPVGNQQTTRISPAAGAIPETHDGCELSAGGVVVRGDELVVIVPVKRAADGRQVLGLPKGHVEPGETPELAAAREVREETGVSGELIGPVGEVSYTYEHHGRQVAKRVVFLLFDYREGDVADHDHEIVEARWMPLRDAAVQLSYEGEREIVRRVLSRPDTVPSRPDMVPSRPDADL
jgi:8-oxo-dGTP pyrophosphatase MutT (NUDIX family)